MDLFVWGVSDRHGSVLIEVHHERRLPLTFSERGGVDAENGRDVRGSKLEELRGIRSKLIQHLWAEVHADAPEGDLRCVNICLNASQTVFTLNVPCPPKLRGQRCTVFMQRIQPTSEALVEPVRNAPLLFLALNWYALRDRI